MVSARYRISRGEWLWAGIVTALAVFLTLIPYALAYLTDGDGWRFTGILMNPEDSQTYFAKILQGYDGKYLYTIPFTPEEHNGEFVGFFYLGLGHLARLLRLSVPAIWHLSRVVANAFMFLATYSFVAYYIRDQSTRRVAMLLAAFGSGLGWALFLANQRYWLGSFPVDFKQPGAHLFFSALTFPHVALGTALTLIGVQLLDQIARNDRREGIPWSLLLAACLVNFSLAIVYPFLLYLMSAIAFTFWVLQTWRAKRLLWQRGVSGAATFTLAAPLAIYYANTLRDNVVFRSWDAQAGTPALPWPHYLIAYGPMLLLAFLSWRGVPGTRLHFSMLSVWICVAAVLLYSPLRPQRRFVQGVHVPLSILASVGLLSSLFPWLGRTRLWGWIVAFPRYSQASLQRFLTVLVLILMSLSNLYVLASVSVSAVVQQPDTIFRPADEFEMVTWLRHEIEDSSVFLADYLSGSFIAGQSGHRVVLGHWAETVDYEVKQEEVATFYSAATNDRFRQELFAKYGVDYVLYGPRERELGAFDPTKVDYLVHVHSQGAISLFSVASPASTS
jgi:hypothetical protein